MRTMTKQDVLDAIATGSHVRVEILEKNEKPVGRRVWLDDEEVDVTEQAANITHKTSACHYARNQNT